MKSDNFPFVSICIPCYNRPSELLRLLNSIDVNKHESNIEILLHENNSPRRKEIKEVVNVFKSKSKYCVRYNENDTNLGFDGNLRSLVDNARGDYIIFMGDDDEFVENNLDHYIDFLLENSHLGYVLKTSRLLHSNGDIENFKYYSDTTFFEASVKSYITLFRKSVFISGFTIKTC